MNKSTFVGYGPDNSINSVHHRLHRWELSGLADQIMCLVNKETCRRVLI